MRYALIENNIVKDIFIEPEGVSIEDCFHPDIVSLYVSCPDNIDEGDLYDPETQEFTEFSGKKFPNYFQWYSEFTSKDHEISQYAENLLPTINDLVMDINRLNEYKTALQFVLTGVDDVIEIDGQQFNGDDFKLMINALKKFEEDKQVILSEHKISIQSTNNTVEIDRYDFSTGWPETTISI